MSSASSDKSRSRRSSATFRIGKVKGYLRGKVWYLCYHEQGQRRRPRVGHDRQAAERLAAQVNGQITSNAPSLFAFEEISIVELRGRWLDHHEHVRRSSLATITRYRTATEHLIRYLQARSSNSCRASQFTLRMAEDFIRVLRTTEVAPNGHPNAPKRTLRDKGIRFILETCRAMFNFAVQRRHLPPYAENPFMSLDLDRIPIEDAKPIVLFTAEEERRFFEACDVWARPIFLTLVLTGLRLGELTHLLIEDLDWEQESVHVRNKPELGWQVKTRSERILPLCPELIRILKNQVSSRSQGLLFQRQKYAMKPGGPGMSSIRAEALRRVDEEQRRLGRPLERQERQGLLKRVWWEAGIVRSEQIRNLFLRTARKIGRPDCTAPKLFRHAFATMLQDANVDPLIRRELMGHSTGEYSDLGMTAVYTHTRWETKRAELLRAIEPRLKRLRLTG